MSFQTPRSIEEMLTAIHRREYLMPAIQREFVWGPDQITKLVDSLMRGYPVGSFLLWDVKPETAQAYTGPSPRILDTVLVDYAAVGSVAARRAS